MVEAHPNSRKVTIYRVTSLALDAQRQGAPEYERLATKFIGSYWAQKQSRVIGTGLLKKEQDILMPQVIGMEPGERGYNEEVKRYYTDLHTSVPYETGKTYETGLEVDNDKPLSADNMPLSIEDYIRYRHAVGGPGVAGSPNVARTKDEATNSNQLIWFYVFDPLRETKALHELGDLKDQALEIYFRVKKDKDKVDMLLTLLGRDPRDLPASADRVIALHKIADENPLELIRVDKVDNFELRYKIKSFINLDIFKIVNGTQIVEKETNALIGNNMNDAVAELQRPERETNMILWLQKMQEGLKAKVRTAKTTR